MKTFELHWFEKTGMKATVKAKNKEEAIEKWRNWDSDMDLAKETGEFETLEDGFQIKEVD